MAECTYSDGTLRAYLDGELPSFEQALVARHVTGCSRCEQMLTELRATAHQVSMLLPAPTEIPHPSATLARLRAEVPNRGLSSAHQSGRKIVNSTRFWSGPRRTAFAAIATLIAAFSLLALPPVRAAANELLDVFRVKSVVFVPISEDRVRELQNLNFDRKSLFLSQPEFEGKAEPRAVASAAEAKSAVGFDVSGVNELPQAATSTETVVTSAQKGTFQVNVQSARELLNLLDVKDVTLPDALGEQPIVVNMQPVAQTKYRSDNYEVTLLQGRSPDVTLPDGVELEQLGRAALQVLGSSPEEAEAMASSIDWSSTLVVPIPESVSELGKVTVNGSPAMMVSDANGEDSRGSRLLYWQNDGTFYVLEARGLDRAELLAAAESVR